MSGSLGSGSVNRRPSLHGDALAFGPNLEDAPAVRQDFLRGERRLSVTSLRLRSDLEVWLMEEIPKLFGAEDSKTLANSLQEDAQTAFLNEQLFSAESLTEEQLALRVETTFGDARETPGFHAFSQNLCFKILEARNAFHQARADNKKVPRHSIVCEEPRPLSGTSDET